MQPGGPLGLTTTQEHRLAALACFEETFAANHQEADADSGQGRLSYAYCLSPDNSTQGWCLPHLFGPFSVHSPGLGFTL